MLRSAVLATPLAVLWMALSSEVNIEGFILGYIIGFAVLMLVQEEVVKVDLQKLPGQIIALIIYVGYLVWEILLSSIDVARLVLDPKCPISPDIVPVSTQDDEHSRYVAGMSMHAITVTPGEMVVGYDEAEGIMYVHCLDSEAALKTLDGDQTRRLKLIRRILGND